MYYNITIFSAEGCKSRVVGCGPDCWSIPHTACDQGQCGCEAGHRAQADTRGQLVTCLPLSHVTNTTMARAEGDINIHYYPGTGKELTRLAVDRVKACFIIDS